MKKFVYILFLTSCLMFAGCDDGKSGDVYGSADEYEDGSSETVDNDSNKNERPDEAPRPGGGGGNGNGNSNGSNGSGDSDSEIPDDENDDSDNENSGGNESIYALEPDVASCSSGIPTDAEKQKVLARLNYIRSIHGLPAVVYNSEGDEITAECSLIIAANNIDGGTLQLEHEPPKSWECWSQEAYDGCKSSNIHVAWAKNKDLSETDSTTIVDAFMVDQNVDSLGHRRWFLDPWLGHISFGRADYTNGSGNSVIGSAIKVIHDDKPDVSNLKIDFIAYPFENYPKELYPDSSTKMSFSVLKDKLNKFGNATNINLDAATIAIIDSTNNKTMAVSGLKTEVGTANSIIGVPNQISWLVSGIKTGTKYNVTISNVLINNASTDYQYWFELK